MSCSETSNKWKSLFQLSGLEIGMKFSEWKEMGVGIGETVKQ